MYMYVYVFALLQLWTVAPVAPNTPRTAADEEARKRELAATRSDLQARILLILDIGAALVCVWCVLLCLP